MEPEPKAPKTAELSPSAAWRDHRRRAGAADRLTASAGEIRRDEAAFAVARLVLALAAAATVLDDPWPSDPWDKAGSAVIVGYPVLAGGLLFLLLARLRTLRRGTTYLLHSLDVFWSTAVLVERPGIVGASALILVILAAAHRWGAPEAIATALVGIGLTLRSLLLQEATTPTTDLTVTLLARSLALVGVAGIVGWLSARQRRLRAQEAFLYSVLRRMQAGHGFARSLGLAVAAARDYYGARDAVLFAREVEGGTVTMWTIPDDAKKPPPRASYVRLDAAARSEAFFATRAEAWHAEWRGSKRWRLLAVDPEGEVLHDPEAVPVAALERLRERTGATRLTGVRIHGEGQWRGRALLLDADRRATDVEGLRFALRLVRELGGLVQANYLLGRLRARVGAMERARVARELHDGTIQSLVAIDMRLDILRRRAEEAKAAGADELGRIQRLLRDEVLELRETMRRLKPVDIGPAQLVGFLDETVARFARDTGIRSVFDCSVEDVDLSPRVCHEIARIVQEALHNVRKHSGAGYVVVRLARADGDWRLVVDDDGRGFRFSGQRTHAELDQMREGPYVIKERVRALGGQLSIDTAPGGGARLEILLPGAQK